VAGSKPVGYFPGVVAFRNFMIVLSLELSIVRQGTERLGATADDGMQGISAGPAFPIGIVAILLLSKRAPRIGLVDLPARWAQDPRRHDALFPGGLNMFAGFILLVVISLARTARSER
jgi:hypothetical protein